MEFTPIAEEDYKVLFQMFNEGMYPEYFRNFWPGCTPQQFKAQLATGGDVLIVHDPKDAAIVGIVSAGFNPMTRMAFAGLLVFEPARHKGFAAEIIKNLAEKVFDKLNANKLVCICSRDDKRSMYLLEKAGFLPEARLRDNTFYSGKLHDELRWAMPRDRYYRLYGKKTKE